VKRNRIINLFIFFLVLNFTTFSTSLALDDIVSVKEVISSTFKHHPLILAQLKDFNSAEEYLKQSLGAFDLNIKSSAEGYTDGYYNGKAFNVFLEKPLFYMNSKAYGGYRKSYGEFPIYGQDLVTQDDGEFFAGIMVSLLRDRSIDSKRFKNLLAQQDVIQSKLQLDQQYIELQTIAAQSYYKWLTDLEKVRVQREILSLAESRIKSFSIRIRKGDLAQIYGLENEQYILKRKYELNTQEQKLYISALYLSLFYRDESGQPIILKPDNPSKINNLKKDKIKLPSELLKVVNSQDLEIKKLQSLLMQNTADQKMGSNDLMPKLDLKYEVREDQGTKVTNLQPMEQKVYLNLEIPIERRLGQGRVNAARAKKDALSFKIKFKKEKNQIEVMSLINNLKLYKLNFDLTKKEINLANKLREAEVKKFNKGASDFILVNFREENVALSKMKNLTAYLDYNLSFIDLQRLAVEFIVPPEKTNKSI
jgi:outer membrane protein TolC